jgi:hypothetical protein
MGREENLTRAPSTYPLPRRGEERKKMKRFKQCALTLALSRRAGREDEEKKFE